jgi:rubrerythrin
VSEKTATDRLRDLLDKRGVEHTDAEDGHTQHTWWSDGDHEIAASNSGKRLAVYNLTPEQAIAATVGARTCRMYRDQYGTWHCTECEKGADKISGNSGEIESWNDSWAPNFCPYCGAKVLSE